MLRATLFTASFLVLLAVPAAAVEPARFLDVISYHGVVVPRPPYQAQESRATLFVFANGTGTVTTASTTIDTASQVRTDRRSLIARGTPTADAFARLGRAAAALQVGLQRDCYLAGNGLTMQDSVTWYGRSGRRNGFVITSFDPSLPACPEAAARLDEALQLYLQALLAAPGTEVLATPQR